VKIFKILGLKNRATGGSIGENTVFEKNIKFKREIFVMDYILEWFACL
jgi:hypothetical protein